MSAVTQSPAVSIHVPLGDFSVECEQPFLAKQSFNGGRAEAVATSMGYVYLFSAPEEAFRTQESTMLGVADTKVKDARLFRICDDGDRLVLIDKQNCVHIKTHIGNGDWRTERIADGIHFDGKTIEWKAKDVLKCVGRDGVVKWLRCKPQNQGFAWSWAQQ